MTIGHILKDSICSDMTVSDKCPPLPYSKNDEIYYKKNHYDHNKTKANEVNCPASSRSHSDIIQQHPSFYLQVQDCSKCKVRSRFSCAFENKDEKKNRFIYKIIMS